MPSGADLIKRHSEIRSALHFYLAQWYKHKRAGTSPDARQVQHELLRFRSLDAITQRVKTSQPQGQAQKPRGGRS